MMWDVILQQGTAVESIKGLSVCTLCGGSPVSSHCPVNVYLDIGNSKLSITASVFLVVLLVSLCVHCDLVAICPGFTPFT